MRKMIRWFLLTLCLVGITACENTDMLQSSTTQKSVQISDEALGRVRCELVRVVDGDTLVVNYEGTEVKVRFIGIDTPESVHSDEGKNTEFGTLASEYTKFLLEGEEFVYLEFDIENMDEYGRYLAYVYLTDSSNFANSLNYVLVESGYAVNKEYPPNLKYADELADACLYAKEQEAGLWQENGIEMVWGE